MQFAFWLKIKAAYSDKISCNTKRQHKSITDITKNPKFPNPRLQHIEHANLYYSRSNSISITPCAHFHLYVYISTTNYDIRIYFTVEITKLCALCALLTSVCNCFCTVFPHSCGQILQTKCSQSPSFSEFFKTHCFIIF